MACLRSCILQCLPEDQLGCQPNVARMISSQDGSPEDNGAFFPAYTNCSSPRLQNGFLNRGEIFSKSGKHQKIRLEYS